MDRFKAYLIFVVILTAGAEAEQVNPQTLELKYGSEQAFTITVNVTSFLTPELLISHPLVTVDFISNSPDVVDVIDGTFSRNLTENDTLIEINPVLASGKAGEGEIAMTVTWYVDGNVSMETFTLLVDVPAPVYLETTMNYALIYVNMLVAFVCIVFVGCDLTPGDILRTWGKTTIWVFSGFILYAVVRPVITLILLKILQFTPPASVGLLAAICSPPSLLAIPVTAVLKGDVALVSVLALMADIIGAAVLPLWVLQFGRMDSNITIEASQVPYSVIILFFLLPLVALLAGMVIRRMRPDAADSMSRVTPIVCFVTLILATSFDIYNLSDTVRLVNAGSGVFGAMEPVTVLFVAFLIAVIFKLDKNKTKAIAVFMLLKGQGVSVATLANAQVKEDQFLSVAACSYLSLMSLLVAMVLACIQCLCARTLDSERDHGFQELVTEIPDDDDTLPFYAFGSDAGDEKPSIAERLLPEKWGLPGSWVFM